METKNTIIMNDVTCLLNIVNTLISTVQVLGDNPDENLGIIASADVILESVKTECVIIQRDFDNYK